MFTGIIEEVGKIKKVGNSGNLRMMEISSSEIQEELSLGSSVSCNGICLTVTDFNARSISVSAMPVTLRKTTAEKWNVGTPVNLERALSIRSRLDGHIVQGHVDAVTTVTKTDIIDKTVIISLSMPKEYSHLIVEQGSIAINGVSLTVSSLTERSFSVSLVDFTLQHTNLGGLRSGNRVNVEFDIVGKYINRRIVTNKRELNEDVLNKFGF